jgi:hypothetical protein
VHLLNANEAEIRDASAAAPTGYVIVIADARDRIARLWAMTCTSSEEQIRRHEAACMGRVIPTFILAVAREVAVDLLAHHAPTLSEQLEDLPGDVGGRVVLAIGSGGTCMTIWGGAS